MTTTKITANEELAVLKKRINTVRAGLSRALEDGRADKLDIAGLLSIVEHAAAKLGDDTRSQELVDLLNLPTLETGTHH